MATATHGSAIVFPTEAFAPLEALLAVHDYKCTALYGVPTIFIAELDLISANSSSHDPPPKNGSSSTMRSAPFSNHSLDPSGFSSLRTGIAAGSQIPSELMRKLHRTLNLYELTICYGMMETSPVSAMTTTDDPIDKRVSTVGRLLPHVCAKIVDSRDRRKILGIGEKGELVVSGYLLMKGHWNDRDKTDEVLVRGDDGEMWMHVSAPFADR